MNNARVRKLSVQLANALEKVELSLPQMAWEDLVSHLSAVEDKFLPLVPVAYQLEAKRRVAEALLRWALLKCRPLDTCQSAFQALQQLGFSDLERSIEYHILYARLLKRNGHLGEGLAVLNQLLSSLQSAQASDHEEAIRWVEAVLAELSPSGGAQ